MVLLRSLLDCRSLRHHAWMQALVERYGQRPSSSPEDRDEFTGSHLAPPAWPASVPDAPAHPLGTPTLESITPPAGTASPEPDPGLSPTHDDEFEADREPTGPVGVPV